MCWVGGSHKTPNPHANCVHEIGFRDAFWLQLFGDLVSQIFCFSLAEFEASPTMRLYSEQPDF